MSFFDNRLLAISERKLAKIIKKNRINPWFFNVVKNRRTRWELWETSLFISEHVSKNAMILETGCGCATNLMWFGQHGYSRLYGTDLDERLLLAGKELAAYLGIDLILWADNSLSPRKLLDSKFDIILALNWTYYLKDFCFKNFLSLYEQHLNKGGIIAIDVVDSIFDTYPNNQYRSYDLKKPVLERRPSEYIYRMAASEVEKIVADAHLKIERVFVRPFNKYSIPRRVYILKK